jgi:hypothetical protein
MTRASSRFSAVLANIELACALLELLPALLQAFEHGPFGG